MTTEQTQQSGNTNPGGGNNAPWYGSFKQDAPADFQQWVTNKNYADPQAALYAHWNAEKLVGAPADQIIRLPKPDDAAAWEGVWNRLGRPAKPEEYELPLPAGDQGEFAKTAAGWFHKAGVPKSAAQAVAKAWNDHMEGYVRQQAEQARAKADGELNALKTEWGNDFDKNAEIGRRGLAEYGKKAGLDDNDLKNIEDALGTGKMLKMFHTLGLTLGEHGFVNGEPTNIGVSPQQARQQLDEARIKRIKNEITEADYHKLVDRLGPLAAKAA
jgi:hypothetical protein